MRVKFRGHASITDLDPNTEWFAIPKEKMGEFLKWLDDQAFYEINPVAVYGTSFTKTTSSPVPFDKERSAAAEVMLDVISSRTRTKKGMLTQLQNKTAHSDRQNMAQAAASAERSRPRTSFERHRFRGQADPVPRYVWPVAAQTGVQDEDTESGPQRMRGSDHAADGRISAHASGSRRTSGSG